MLILKLFADQLIGLTIWISSCMSFILIVVIAAVFPMTKISEYLIFRDILYNDALQSCEELNKLLR